jgi:hypothetical protein
MKHLATALLMFGIMVSAPTAARADTNCSTDLTSGTINGNLIVPAGAECSLNGTTVTGNVKVEKGAQLLVFSGTIYGNVQGHQCKSVFLTASGAISVGGNLQIQNCTGTGDNGYSNSGLSVTIEIDGNFQCQNNDGPCLAEGGTVLNNVQVIDNSGPAFIESAMIHGNLQVSGNNGGSTDPGAVVTGDAVMGNAQVNGNSGTGNVSVANNVVQGNLQCASNTPGVNGAGSNTVGGHIQGQCVIP